MNAATERALSQGRQVYIYLAGQSTNSSLADETTKNQKKLRDLYGVTAERVCHSTIQSTAGVTGHRKARAAEQASIGHFDRADMLNVGSGGEGRVPDDERIGHICLLAEVLPRDGLKRKRMSDL